MPPPKPPPPPPPSVSRAELEGQGRELLVAALKLQLDAAEQVYQKAAADEMDQMLETQRQLSERKRQLQAAVSGRC